MHLTLASALALAALWPSVVLAAPLALRFAVTAEETAARVEDHGRYLFPIAAFDGNTVPAGAVEGRLDQRAYLLKDTRETTLALISPLAAQLEAAGFTPVFQCETTACGGFDFRYGMDVLPEPGMHVDLGDFRYLLARDGKGAMVSLLVSRALDRGFVQVTSVMPGDAPEGLATQTGAAAPPDAEAVSEPQAEPLPEPLAQAVPEGAENLGEVLAARGVAPLDDLVFASGKAVLEAGDYPSLAALADWLKANPGATVTLVGHTDATGSLSGNIALSRARAQAVRERLVTVLGAEPSRIEAEGAGYLAPRASNQTPEGRQANRRVEVMVTSVAE